MKKLQKPILDKEAMIKWLGEIIDAEMEKGDDEIDMALVMECDAYLAELMSDVVISEEQMAKNIASIKGKTCNDKITSTKRRTPRMRRIIAAICAAAVIIGGTVTAYAFVPAFRDMVRDVLNLGQGSSVDEGGITYVYAGKTATYKSIDELIQSENLDILYPHDLPDELKIKSITGSGEGNLLTYFISFNDSSLSISIDVGEIDVSKLSSDSEMFKNQHDIISYILSEQTLFTSVTVHNGYTYYITTHDKAYITTILENLY